MGRKVKHKIDLQLLSGSKLHTNNLLTSWKMKKRPGGHIQVQLFTRQWMVLWEPTGSRKTANGSRCQVKNDYKYESWIKALRFCRRCCGCADTIQEKRQVFEIPNKKEILADTQLQKSKLLTNSTCNNDIFHPEVILFIHYSFCTVTSPVWGCVKL